VLACGLAVTVFSDLPSLRLFGWLSAFSMIAALVADLFILRPTVTFLRRLAQSRADQRPPARLPVAGRAQPLRMVIETSCTSAAAPGSVTTCWLPRVETARLAENRRLPRAPGWCRAGPPRDIAADVAAGLEEAAGDRPALARDVAPEVEAVAVAGAAQILLHAVAAVRHRVVGAAADALARPARHADRAVARPRPFEVLERPGPAALRQGGGGRKCHDGGDGRKAERACRRSGQMREHRRTLVWFHCGCTFSVARE
jgi:hypothetical protein